MIWMVWKYRTALAKFQTNIRALLYNLMWSAQKPTTSQEQERFNLFDFLADEIYFHR